MRLILIRHGNTFEPGATPLQVGKKTDLPLVKSGKEQARALGEYFKGEKIAAIYTGNLRRQQETADTMIEVMGYQGPVYRDEALTEIDYGLWEGKTFHEIDEVWASEHKAWSASCNWPEGIFGGTLELHLALIEAFCQSLIEKYPPQSLILGVGSGGSIRFFYALLKKEWERLCREKRIPELKVCTGHFCEFHLTKKGIERVSWNQSPQA